MLSDEVKTTRVTTSIAPIVILGQWQVMRPGSITLIPRANKNPWSGNQEV